MNGSRRVGGTPVLPRSGPLCLFKGHLSTKSNAVIDCSVPLSMGASIKYADQQRREKLKKELAQCEKKLKLNKIAAQANSKTNSKSLSNTLPKPAEKTQNEDSMEEVHGYSPFARSSVTSSERLHLSLPKSNKVLRDGTEKSSSSFLASIDYTTSRPRRMGSATLYGQRPRSALPNYHQSQLVISKASSGDLLDKHSKLFSNGHLPFTPRTLKTEAKSFLSQYRYYTPAKRKKDFTDQRVEAETQTELSSFKSDFERVETKDFTDSEVNIKQASSCGTKENITPLPLQGNALPWDDIKGGALQCSPARVVCQCSEQPHSRRKIYSDEEELLYLSFIEDVTDEILKLGLFSNRSLERLFERHVRQNKHHLEEGKMRYLLHILKVNLGCISQENSVRLDDAGMLNLLDFEKAGNSAQNERDEAVQQERREYRKALDLFLSVPEDDGGTSPNEFFLPAYKSKYSEGVTVQQVDNETNLGPSTEDEKNPSLSDSLRDRETSVTVIEGDSDTEKAETPNELCCVRPALSNCGQLCRVTGGSRHELEEPTLQIMEMSIEDCPLDV
ncbi:PREDICTED: spermatogenesis-associated protein 7 isoform X2 [Miniopterus natalensis]|uniref:spermatogenesis-associated protein 7 isoform X2 n=1 Tax=Miniopterus natalensis TaxID=291302 RepID=UPI0007A6ACE6|nr:PREDICTED: spermatogenesis-associated protein 7 isoform X2 [Miniopterus natalensis]